MRRLIARTASIAAGTITVLHLATLLTDQPKEPKDRRRYGILETRDKMYFGVGDRVKHGKEYLRTASGARWARRRGRVTGIRKLVQYQGDPNPRQLVTVTWDGEDEPSKLLNESLNLVSRSLS